MSMAPSRSRQSIAPFTNLYRKMRSWNFCLEKSDWRLNCSSKVATGSVQVSVSKFESHKSDKFWLYAVELFSVPKLVRGPKISEQYSSIRRIRVLNSINSISGDVKPLLERPINPRREEAWDGHEGWVCKIPPRSLTVCIILRLVPSILLCNHIMCGLFWLKNIAWHFDTFNSMALEAFQLPQIGCDAASLDLSQRLLYRTPLFHWLRTEDRFI